MPTEKSIPRIPELFSGREIFITGGTGFLGKSLIEKFVRSCPGIKKIHVLIRPRKSKSAESRLSDLMKDPVFDRVKQELPGELETKLQAVPGDASLPELGLSPEDRSYIEENISFIFHSAASVKFDDPLREAVLLNVRGARDCAQLAVEAAKNKLLAFIHVSSAFSNCERKSADEFLYPAPANWNETIQISEQCEPNILNLLQAKYSEGMPNTYTFTKRLAEHAVSDICTGKVPVKIIRPSIVVSSISEPVPGWIDNFNGPVGMTAAYGKGVMRTMYARVENKPDYIPVDVVTKSIIVAAWDLGLRGQKSEVEIMHCTSYEIEWSRPSVAKLVKIGLQELEKIPMGTPIWTPSSHTSPHSALCYIRTIIAQLIPAILVDAILKISGKKPILIRLQKKIYTAGLALRYFTMNQWTYSNYNLLELRKNVLVEDCKDFDYDFRQGNINEFIRNALLGSRRYLFKESDDLIPLARKHYKRMKWLDSIVKTFFTLMFCWLLYTCTLPSV